MEFQFTLWSETLRFLVVAAPSAAVCITAALLLLGEDIRSQWKQIVLFGVLDGLYMIGTLVLASGIPLWKIIPNALGFFLLLKLVFRWSWKETLIRWVIAFCGVTMLVEIAAAAILIPLAGFNYHRLSIGFDQAAIAYWPVFALALLAAWLARRNGYQLGPVVRSIKATWSYPEARKVYIMLTIQYAVVLSFMLHFIISSDWANRSMAEYGFLFLGALIIMVLSYRSVYKFSGSVEKRIIGNAEASISDNVMELVGAVHGQRHDFINHIVVLQELNSQADQAAVSTYLDYLGASVRQVNDVLKINNVFIGSLLNARMAQAETKNIAFQVDVNADLADYGARSFDLVRILGNLINNALDAVETQGGERFIRVEIEQKGPLVYFQVTNSGRIESEQGDCLFDPGYSSKSGPHQGLGLYIVKQLVEKLGGSIRLTVDEGPATRFSFEIPRA